MKTLTDYISDYILEYGSLNGCHSISDSYIQFMEDILGNEDEELYYMPVDEVLGFSFRLHCQMKLREKGLNFKF